MNTITHTTPINLSISSARHKMIEQQIRPWGIWDLDVLRALELIKREHFVTEDQINLAFTDTEISILNTSEVMLEPKIEARVLQTIKPTGKESVLEIGTGSGYMAALLGYFAKQVTSVDINSDLIKFAQENLNKSKIPNVKLEVGDAAHGWGNNSYDIICVSGGLPALSDSLKAQLNIGGKLFAFVGKEPVMTAIVVTRVSHDYFQTEGIFETFVPMLKVPENELSSFVF